MNHKYLKDVIQGHSIILVPRSIKIVLAIKTLYNHLNINYENDKFCIVTRYEIKNMEGIENATLLRYSDVSTINSKKNIIFDSIERYYLLKEKYTFDDKCNLIFLSSWGDSIKVLENFCKDFPNTKALVLDTFSISKDITFEVIRTPNISKEFYEFYSSVREYELHSYKNGDADSAFPVTRMVTNYLYPNDLIEDAVNDNLKECKNINIEEDYRWVTKDDYKKLNYNSPKVYRLLQEIRLAFIKNKNSKIIVISKYVKRFGIDLVYAFLYEAIRAKEIKISKDDDIFVTSCLDDKEDVLDEIREFKNAKRGVLLTNVIPDIENMAVDNVIILDCYRFVSLKNIIRACRPNNETYDIKFIVATSPDPEEQLSDESLNMMLFMTLNLYENFFLNLCDHSAKIIKMSNSEDLIVNSPLEIKKPIKFEKNYAEGDVEEEKLCMKCIQDEFN